MALATISGRTLTVVCLPNATVFLFGFPMPSFKVATTNSVTRWVFHYTGSGFLRCRVQIGSVSHWCIYLLLMHICANFVFYTSRVPVLTNMFPKGSMALSALRCPRRTQNQIILRVSILQGLRRCQPAVRGRDHREPPGR